jgi:hypothetical protein
MPLAAFQALIDDAVEAICPRTGLDPTLLRDRVIAGAGAGF